MSFGPCLECNSLVTCDMLRAPSFDCFDLLEEFRVEGAGVRQLIAESFLAELIKVTVSEWQVLDHRRQTTN
jgi:hypothetical protein